MCLRIVVRFVFTKYPMKAGFTLVEISIVLVIIGLVIGGILVGQDLIFTARLRSVTSEVQKYEVAVNTFRLKFNCLSGDCSNATDYMVTTNGDGNGKIGSPTLIEMHLFWQHLALAGLISGNYSGVGVGGQQGVVIGTNAPQSSYSSGSGYAFNTGVVTYGMGSGVTFARYYNSIISFGLNDNIIAVGIGNLNAGVLTPTQALLLDRKYDDGSPANGYISTFTNLVNLCTTGTTLTAAYNTANSRLICPILFNMPF